MDISNVRIDSGSVLLPVSICIAGGLLHSFTCVDVVPILQNIKAAVADQPDASFETIIEFAAGAWVKNVSELVKQNPSVRKYYDKLKHAPVKKNNLPQGTEYSI